MDQGYHRIHQPGCLHLGTRKHLVRRRDSRLADGAPLQHRHLAKGGNRAGRRAPRHPTHRRGNARHFPPGRLPGRAGQATGDLPLLKLPGHHQPGEGADREGSRLRSKGADRRGPERATHAGKRGRTGLRLPGLLRAQDARSDRNWRPVREARHPRGDRAVHARWGHGPGGLERPRDMERRAQQIRGRYAQHRRRDRTGRRSRLPVRSGHGQCTGTRKGSYRVRAGALQGV